MVVCRLNDGSIIGVSMGTAEAASSEKKAIMAAGEMTFNGVRYPVNMGIKLEMKPTGTLKVSKEWGYEVVETKHCGRVFGVAHLIGEVLDPFAGKLEIRKTREFYLNNHDKEWVLNKLVAAGYPTDCDGLVDSLSSMTREALVDVYIAALSTVQLSLWGDHGPIDGKSHIMFVQTVHLKRFQFKEEVTDSEFQLISSRLATEVRPVLVCRMSSALQPSLGACNALGEMFKPLLNNLSIKVPYGTGPDEVHTYNVIIRWATGDLKFQQMCCMIQCAGNGADSCTHPSTPLPRKFYDKFAR